MADAAVRVDIIAGRNTVVPAAQQTTQALTGLSGASRGANFAFEDLNRKGLTKLSSGFKSLAFHAAGVPGPMGKIAEGALLLGGGSGVLLGVAAAAGAVAIAWNAMTNAGREMEAMFKDLNGLLPKNTNEAEKVAAGWKKYGDLVREANQIEARAIATRTPLLLQKAQKLREEAEELRRLLNALELQIPTIGGGDKPGKAGTFEHDDLWLRINKALASGLAPGAGGRDAVPLRPFGISEPGESPFDMMAEAEKRAFLRMEQQRADFLEMSQQFTQMLNDILLGGIVELGMALAEAIGSGRGFGSVLLEAFGGLMQRIGALMIEFGVALLNLQPLLANLFTSGPAMIAAGVLIAAAGAAVSKAAQGKQVSPHAASGGVSGRQYERDQQALGAPGTVTVKMQDGFIRPSDPAFQEWLAEVIRQAKGRNVVFA